MPSHGLTNPWNASVHVAYDDRLYLRLPAELLAGLEGARRAHGRRSVSEEARAALEAWVAALAERVAEGRPDERE